MEAPSGGSAKPGPLGPDSLLECNYYLALFRLIYCSPVKRIRGVRCRRFTITADGLFSGYKIGGNLARKKLQRSVVKNISVTSATEKLL
jgi:hypothetical protein